MFAMKWAKVDNTEIVVAKKEYLLLLFFDKCGLSFLWITRKLLHKWLTIYFSTLESPWKSSMMMTMFWAIAKKPSPSNLLFSSSFSFCSDLIFRCLPRWEFFFGFHHKVEERGICPCFSATPLTPKRNNALNHLLLSGELLLSHFCFSRVDKFFKNLHFTLKWNLLCLDKGEFFLVV